MAHSPFAHFADSNGLLLSPLEAYSGGGQQEFLYSADKARRYAYRLCWDATKPYVLWVMLNPGTGETEQRRRNTLERCISWSKQWGFGGLLIGNVFAVRTRSARELVRQELSSDPLNEEALALMRELATETVVAWGGKGARHRRSSTIAPLLAGANCLGFTAKGEPRHPLYVPSATVRVPWVPSIRP